MTTLSDMNDRRARGLCPFCGASVKDLKFKDARSEKEFGISGMCQECQDGFFKEGYVAVGVRKECPNPSKEIQKKDRTSGDIKPK